MRIVEQIVKRVPVKLGKVIMAWYNVRLGVLVARGDQPYVELALNKPSAVIVANAIDLGIGRSLIEAGDGSAYFSFQTNRHHDGKSRKTLTEAWH